MHSHVQNVRIRISPRTRYHSAVRRGCKEIKKKKGEVGEEATENLAGDEGVEAAEEERQKRTKRRTRTRTLGKHKLEYHKVHTVVLTKMAI